VGPCSGRRNQNPAAVRSSTLGRKGLLSTREQEHWDINLTIDGVAETTGPYDSFDAAERAIVELTQKHSIPQSLFAAALNAVGSRIRATPPDQPRSRQPKYLEPLNKPLQQDTGDSVTSKVVDRQRAAEGW
jgi:hypothetical protein